MELNTSPPLPPPPSGRQEEGMSPPPPPTSIEDICNINLVPSELFLKFRKEVRGIRIGLNTEFYNYEINEFRGKLVLKPLSPDRRWKFICDPVQGDVRIMSKKIPLTNFLNLQVGIGHNYHLNAIAWKWRLCSGWGGDGISQIRNKTRIGLLPGFDIRLCWKADYVLPEMHGALGTGEPAFEWGYGRFQASLDRVEAILTH